MELHDLGDYAVQFLQSELTRQSRRVILPALIGIALGAAADMPRPGGSLSGINQSDIDRFVAARDNFAEVEGVADGLGPRFNGTSCAACHAHPAIGGTSPAVNPQIDAATEAGATNLVPSFITPSGPVREVRFPGDGRVHDLFTVAGRSDAQGCNLGQPDFAAQPVTFRIPTPLFGLGLVAQTSDATLDADVAFVRERRQRLAVAGHFNHVGERIAKFGWKAQHSNLRDFSAEAYAVEMGVTNELFPVELDQDAGCQFNAVPESQRDVDEFVLFMQLLAPPTLGPPTPETLRGKFAFDAAGCNVCHIERHTTDSTSPSAANVTYSPFSDFQVHSMGSLADGVRQGETAGDEFRTAPLWGVGQRLFFLHDGRTSDLDEAIQAHASPGSEASASVALYDAFPADDRQALLKFLGSL